MTDTIHYAIPDPDANNPLAHLAELSDGDYKTGRRADGYYPDGINKVDVVYDEVVIIKNHKLIGLRLPNGKASIFPPEPNLEFNPPDITFPLPPTE